MNVLILHQAQNYLRGQFLDACRETGGVILTTSRGTFYAEKRAWRAISETNDDWKHGIQGTIILVEG